MLKIIGFVFLGLLLLLLLLLLLPIRVRVRYDGTFRLWAGLGAVDFLILPLKKKSKKPKLQTEKTKKKKRLKTNKSKKQTQKFTLDEIFSYARLILDALGKLKRRLVIRHLELALNVGGRDAGTAALTYGRIAAGISALYPILQRNLRIRKTDIRVDAALEQTEINAVADIAVAACPLRLLVAAMVILMEFLKVKRKKKTTGFVNDTEKGGTSNEQHQ